ncbi:MAG: hypothetical protein KDI42_00095, partial [Gammaproteobacteria bacterium]|nr:hypothetical protein [Gammaproteobacteria bacterium]
DGLKRFSEWARRLAIATELDPAYTMFPCALVSISFFRQAEACLVKFASASGRFLRPCAPVLHDLPLALSAR